MGVEMRSNLLKYRFIYALFRRNLHQFFKSQAQLNLDKQSFRLGKTNVYLVYEASLIRECFNKGKNLPREPLTKLIGGLLADESCSASLDRRRLIENVIDQHVISYIDHCILHHYDGFLCQPLSNNLILKQLKRLSLETSVAIVLSPKCIAEQRLLCDAVQTLVDYREHHKYSRLPMSKKRKRERGIAEQQIMTYVSRCLTKQIELDSEYSLLSCLLTLFDKKQLESEEINQEVLAFLGGCVEAAGGMLFWVLKCFLQFESASQRLSEVIVRENLTINDALSHSQFQSFVMEILRFYPAASTLGRFVEDNSIAGIEAGSYVWMSPMMAHFDERYWLDPNSFNPQRFSQGIETSAFFPFAQDEHNCVGEYLALAQMKAFLYVCATRLDRDESLLTVRRISAMLTLAPRSVKGSVAFE